MEKSESWYDTVVPSEGSKDARIVIVGEAPGKQEEKERRPFVGGAGKVLDRILDDVGVRREECYITNVCKQRPRNNDFSFFYEDKKRTQPTEFLNYSIAYLRAEIEEISPNVIITLGNEPLKILTGKNGITNWRGSVLESSCGKVVPTYHPAAILRNWSWRAISLLDFKKAKKEAEFREVKQTQRSLLTDLSFEELDRELGCLNKADAVAFDVETETHQINCLSFAESPSRAVCVPLWFGSSGSLWSEEQEVRLWERIKDILENPKVKKIAQNYQYDAYFLSLYGIKIQGLWLDTMIAWHTMYSELPKGLDFLCSVYTDQPYYKFMRKTQAMPEFFRYNALDACVTYEVAMKEYEDLKAFGMWEFYQNVPHKLIEPLLEMTLRGVRIDTEKLRELKSAYKEKWKELEDKLAEEVGYDLNVNSNKQMTRYLYKELGLKEKFKQRKKGVKTLSADEEALVELKRKHDIPALDIILKMRECKKILSTYLEMKLDEDKRVRASYYITGTETGRLSSQSSPKGTGTNLQNIPVDKIGELFIPDEGKVFVEADLSQAEARVVAFLAGEESLIRAFSNGGDVHRKTASQIFNKPESEVTHEERQLAKKSVHATNYGMGPRTFAKHIRKSESEAKRLINRYFATYPKIKLWQMKIAQELSKKRVLSNPLGRRRIFFGSWNRGLRNEGYAFIPQSTVSDLLNIGLVCLWEKFREEKKDCQIMLQVHDSVIVQCKREDVVYVKKAMYECLERPIGVNGSSMSIPATVHIGTNWKELKNG